MGTDTKFIIDAHLDLSMNAIEWNRDLRKSVAELRLAEAGMTDRPDRGKGTVSLPDLRRGAVGLVVATQIGRYVESGSALPGWNAPEIAWAITQAQLAWYQALEAKGELVSIKSAGDLMSHVNLWLNSEKPNSEKPIGFILSLEGADSLIDISYLEKAYGYGLRACGPAHYGPGRYACGTGGDDGFTRAGLELLKEMDRLDMILDVTHLTDKGFKQALSSYSGAIWASHHNCRSIVDHQRQLTDDQISMLVERKAVIGGVLDAWMLCNDWQRGIDDPRKRNVRLVNVIDHYDHICQIAGNSRHIAIGSDLDGGYGLEQSPHDLDTIADLQLLKDLLTKRGFTPEDIENIFYKNWLRFLLEVWEK